MHRYLNLVVAVCNNFGIGIKGELPWRLRGDMKFFSKITSETKDSDKTNVVIMGRKTWASIPEKFRPLPNRTNIVVSSTLNSVPEGVLIARDFEHALSLAFGLQQENAVENVFVIGGSSIYEQALKSDFPCRIYLTRVLSDFKCDTFFPQLNNDKYVSVSIPEIPEEVQEENGTSYLFQVLQEKEEN